MGLDMYLERFPRYKKFKPIDIYNVGRYIEWKKNPKAQEYSLSQWCGVKEEDIPCEEDVNELAKLYGERFYAWDDEHRYPSEGIEEHVGYWRKANAIHKWFVEHVQDGEDDCAYHNEVTKDVLEELQDACEEVLTNAVLMRGKVTNGYHLEGNKWEPIYEDGKIVVNPDICKDVLPCTSGCFFGSTEYNEWYIEDVKYTYELCRKLLEETDFDKQMIYYCSSW